MTVQPLLLELQSSGRDSSATILVTNGGPTPLPVELDVERLSLDDNGKQHLTPDHDKWLIFPPQAIIRSGGKQNFRIQWLGDPALSESESFHIIVKQVPVTMPEGKSGVQLVYNFRSLVNVAPTGTVGKLEVTNALLTQTPNGSHKIDLTLKNESNTHTSLSAHEMRIKITDNSSGTSLWTHKLTPGDILSLVGIGLLQPHRTRKITLPLEIPASIANHENTRIEVSLRNQDAL